MSPQIFTTYQVSILTGLSVRQLNHWSQHKLFVPSAHQARGPGTRNLYTRADVVQLLSLKKLKCYRWSTQKIRKAVTMLREVMHDDNPLRQALLLADARTMIAVYKTKAGEQILLDALAGGGQQVLGIVLEILEVETQQAIARLRQCESLPQGTVE
jgi:DNA-binding transcriptional MerR regulator